MNLTYTFSQSFIVHDPEQLVQAARAHVDAVGMSTESFYEDGGEVDVGVCLGILLDPGVLPGCTAHNHTVE